MKLTGAKIVLKCLEAEGVDCIFGYPGGAILHVYDEIYKQDAIEHILVRHEQGAVHAADGYARASGKVGVAMVTSGPGITNGVTGIATAYMDSIPMVVISGQVPSNLVGSDAFQEVDAVGITRPCTKHNFLVKSAAEIAPTIKKAFYIARSGRPGPVLVDLPKDVTAEIADFNYPKTIEMQTYKPRIEGHVGQIDRATRLLKNAKKPIVYVGGGAVLSNARDEIREFIDMCDFPVTQTLMALGAFPGTDERFLGMLGMHGTYEANMAMHDCDVMFAIGARFDDRITGALDSFSPNSKKIHIDIDTANIDKTVLVDVPIVGDCKVVMGQINKEFKKIIDRVGKKTLTNQTANWWKKINEWRALESLVYEKSEDLIKPQDVIERVYRITKGDAFIASDVGQHQMWAAQYYPFDEPRRWLNSGGLGTMGFGLPAAMGAKFAEPDRESVCITGDGSIQMMLQELATCLQYRKSVKIINLNNGYLGMVRQWQEFFYRQRYSMSYFESLPDFVKLAEGYGHIGIQVKHPSELDEALKKTFSEKTKCVFLDVLVDPSENVYPMISAGSPHNKMHLSKHSNNLASQLENKKSYGRKKT